MSDNTSIEEVELRIENTIEYIENKTRTAQVKQFFKHAYKQGYFYSIPPRFFDKEKDEMFLREMYLSFGFNTIDGKAVPDGFEGVLEPEVYQIMFNEMLKVGSRDYGILFGYIPKRVLEELGDGVKEIKNVELETFTPEQLDEVLLRVENGDTVFETDKLFYDPNNINRLIERFFEKHPDANEHEIVELFIRMFGKWYEEIAKGTANIYNDYINNDVESMIRYCIYRYNEKDIVNLDTEQKEDVIRNFEEQRKLLIAMLKNLSKVGALDELVESENRSIDKLNIMFSDENKINHVTKESVFERVNTLDLTSREDVIELFLLSRHYANKLAHNYDNYMWTTLFLNTVSDKEFVEIKNKKKADKELLREAIFEELEELFDNMGNDKESYDAFVKGMRGFGKNEKFIKNNLNPRNPRAKDLLKKIVWQSVKEDQIQNYDSRIVYTKKLFDSIEELRRLYHRAYNGIINNDIEPPNFIEFLRASYEREFFEVQYSHLRVNRNNKEEKVIDVLKELKSIIEKDGVLLNSKEVLLNIAQKLDMRENVFDLKHFYTMSLYYESKRDDTEVRMENTPAKIVYVQTGDKEEKDGVVDVYKDGYIQVFGGHYKIDDFESTSKEIQSLDGTHQDISEAFFINDVSKSLKTFIIIPKLTNSQTNECKKVYELFKCIEQGETPNDGMDKNMYTRIQKIREDDVELYKALKIRCALGVGIDFYKEKYQMLRVVSDEERLSEEETRVVTAMQEKLGSSGKLNQVIRNNAVNVDNRVVDFFNRVLLQGEISYSDVNFESRKLINGLRERDSESEIRKNDEEL